MISTCDFYYSKFIYHYAQPIQFKFGAEFKIIISKYSLLDHVKCIIQTNQNAWLLRKDNER